MSIPKIRGDGARSPGRRPRRFLMRRRTWAALAVASAAVLAMGIGIPAAQAVHDTGLFELDGNATSSTASPQTPPDDWDRVCHQVTGSDCSTTFNTSGATAVDWVSEPNLNSTIFTGGGSKDPSDVSQWAWKDGAGGLPDKDNLLHSFAARYNTNEGTVLYFGSDRLDNSGDAQQGFWFFQNPITLGTNSVGGGSGFNGVHAPGDLLVISDFSNGGSTSTISVYEWDPTVSGNLRLLETSTSANCATAAANDKFCGIVNPSTITMPWSFTDKSGTPNNGALNGEFYEGGVNLSTLGLADRCFSSVASETRSSTSTTATLKDFILVGFGKCQTAVQTTPKDANGGAIPAGGLSIGTGSVKVTDQATVSVSGVSTWSGSLQFSLCGPLTSAAGCASGGTTIGSAIPIDNTTTQPISSALATLTSVGTYCWRGDFTPSADSASKGVKPGSDGSPTECFTVNPVTPTLATQAGAGPVLLGNPISDTATLTGTANEPGTPVINPTTAGSPAGGTITFTAFGPNDCSTVAFTTTRAVSGDGMYPTASQAAVSFTPTAVGTYHWAATYSGDPPNTNGTSHNTSCTDTAEDVVVQQVPSSMTSVQSFIPNDSATVSAPAGGPLNGSVNFQVFESSDCSGTAIYTQDVTVSGASPQTVSTTNTTVSTTAANVSWKLTYTSHNPGQKSIPASCVEKSALTITNDGPVSSP